MSEPSKSRVAIYAAGGCGINIGRLITPDFGEVEVYSIDTSESNLRKPGIDRDRIFLFEGIDGSGKVRAENHSVISKSTLKILQQFKPGNFNIVICSASGGSGSVIGHSLIGELRKRGEQVVVILVGSTASHIEIENSVKTLKSLDALAHKLDQPVVMHYLENSAQHARAAIDGMAAGAVTMLLALFSGQHDELDTADLRNWLNHKALGAEVVSLQFSHSSEDYRLARDVVSVATLALHGMNTILDPVPAYQTVGYAPADWNQGKNKLIKDEPINYLLSAEIVESVSASLNARLKDVTDVMSSRIRRGSLLDKSDDVGEDGIVL